MALETLGPLLVVWLASKKGNWVEMKKKYLLMAVILQVVILTLFAFPASALCKGKAEFPPDDFTLGSLELIGHRWVMGYIWVRDDVVEIKKTTDGVVTSIPRGYVKKIKYGLHVW